LHTDDPLATPLEAGHGNAAPKSGAAQPSDFERQAAWLEPAVAGAEPGIANFGGQVREPAAGVIAVEQLDIVEAPGALGCDQLPLPLRSVIGQGGEQVPLVPKAQPGPLVHLVEESHALSNQLDLLGVVELQAKGAGRYRGGQRGEGGALLQHERLEAGAFREQGGGASDDASTDDDEIGGIGR
jgi:hypothetical protein